MNTFPDVKYHDITIQITGRNGNAYAIMGMVMHEMRKHKVPNEEITRFADECMSGDYDRLLQTCMRWVNVR